MEPKDAIAAYLAEWNGTAGRVMRLPEPEELKAGAEILAQDRTFGAAFVVAALERIAEEATGVDRLRVGTSTALALRGILSTLLRSALPFSEAQLLTAVRSMVRCRSPLDTYLPHGPVVRAVERHLERHVAGPALREALVEARTWAIGGDGDLRKTAARVQRLLTPVGLADEPVVPIETCEAWGTEARAWVAALPPEPRLAWLALLNHAAASKGKSAPTRSWLTAVGPLVAAVGREAFAERLARWLEVVRLGARPDDPEWNRLSATPVPIGPTDANLDLLKGLIWALAPEATDADASVIGRFAERCFKKIPNFGPGSPRMGNACLWALGALPEHRGVARLSRLAGRVRTASAKKLVDKALDEAARAAGTSREDLEELAVPTLELDDDGTRSEAVGPSTATLALTGGRAAALRWVRADGREVDAPPQEAKDADPERVKELKKEKEELAQLVAGQCERLERLLLSGRTWSFEAWRARFLEHPVLGYLARRLIWHLGEARVCWGEGALRLRDGQPATAPADAPVRLWHPMDDGAAEVLAWRARLEALGVVQPFKQAHREVYLLTPAERESRTHSNRFAAHILRQHAFKELCSQRGWRYTLIGAWDSHNVPTRAVPELGVEVSLWVEPLTGRDPGYTGYAHVVTDQVRFTVGGRQVDLVEVPPRAFSELMRDVDLFVGVCSVANDPTWGDGVGVDHREAWLGWAFGELQEIAVTRRDVLERLLPRLAVGKVCRVEGRWLHVQGRKRAYRIHLGSGNVQLEPEHRYLCIVADPRARSEKVLLPFEGDDMVALILSKAVLLSRDDQITDRSILAQLG